MIRKLRMGLIGGGKGAFIGRVHHMAAILDNEIELVCGAFSSDPQVSKASGSDYKLPASRVYESYEAMFNKELLLSKEERMDFVTIVTPNYLHFHPAKLAMEKGFHVVCDKPMTFSLKEALDLRALGDKTGLVFALTHTYNGYPMVKEARQIVNSGKLGKLKKVLVEYTQGWLAELQEAKGNKQASWRADPKKAGVACTMGDIGVHAFNLAEYVTGLKVKQLCADISTMVPGRKLDDDGAILLRFDNGVHGVIVESQICAGDENDVRLRVFGEKGGLEWHQMEPNSLELKWLDRSKEIIRTGVGSLSESAKAHTRIPAGHPEGFIEAFANIYRNFAFAVHAQMNGTKPDPIYDFPGIKEGVRGMAFIEKAIESGRSDQKWFELGL
jgi:predicted dehydrogenase